MGNLLRRVLAFVLGMVFTIAAAAGSMVGGAYWAYKNVKPIGIVSDDPAFGDLRDQSIEDLMVLLNGALNDPDKYTLARLEAEYGLDLEGVLKKLGIENIDKTGSNWEALTAISLFSVKDGIPALLGEVKLRALYNFLPSLTGKRLKDILSPEAQEKLGDYTLMELFESDELTKETGLLKAIKNLRVGAVLPAYFDCEYDEETHTFNYVLSDSEEAQKLPVLKIVGNVSFGIINKIISGGDIMNELMEGSLSSVAEMPLEEILTAVASTISQDVGEKVSSYAKFLGGARLSDLFVKNADGGYEFYYAKVLGGVKLGYLFGLDDEDGDGVWTDKNGEPAKDMLQMLANLNVSSVFNDEGTFAMIRDLVGDLSVGMVLDMAGVKEGDIPLLDAISGLQISELLKDQGKTFDANLFVKSLINNLASSLGDRTLGELIFSPGNEPTETNALIEALFNLKVSDFVKENYTFESVLEAFRNALGNISIGDIIGTEKNADGTWKTDDKVLALVLDFSFNNIFDVLSSDYSVKEIINSLLPETRVGEVFSAFMGFEYDDENGRYYKENNGEKKYLSVEISELFDCKLADVAGGLLDKNDPFDSYAMLEKVMLGDLADVIVTWLGETVEELSYITDDEGNGRYVWEAQADGAVSDLLSTSIAGFVKDIYGGGNELLAKNVDDYVRIAGALTRFIAKKSGYKGDIDGITSAIEDIACDMLDGTLKDTKVDPSAVQFESLVNAVGEVVGLIFPESETAVDKATVIVNDLFEGDVKGGVKVNETTEIKKLIEDSYSFVADFIPEGDFKKILGKTIEEYAALYGVRRIKEFKQATLDINVREVVFAVRDIALEAVPDDKNKIESVINSVAELAGDLISGTIGNCGFNQNLPIEKLVGNVKDVANVFIPEGKAKEISDAAFDGLAGLYGKEVLGNIGPASKNISLESIIGYVTDIVKVAAPESETVVDKATLVVNDLFEGTLSGVRINETTEIKKLIEDVYSLVCEFIPEGTVRNITDTAADEISSLYGVRRIKEFKQATLDINVRDLIFAVNAIALKAIPESNEKVRSAVTATAELAGDLISGTIGNCGFNQNLPIEKLVGDVNDVANVFIPEGKAKEISDTAFDGLAGLYGKEVLGNFGPATKNIKIDELVTVVSDVIIAAAPESESKVKSASVVVNDLFSGTLGDFGFNQNTLVRALAFDVYDLVAEFVKNEKARSILTAIICEGGNLYETAVLKEFVEKTKTIGIDDYIGYVANVAKSTEKVPDDTINAISDLAQYVAKGNIKEGIKLDGDAEIAVIADLTQSAFLTFKIGGTAETIISAMLNAFAELYADATIRTFVEKSKDIEITKLVSELCEVGRSATDDAAAQGKVTHVEDLLCYVLDGKVTSIGANKGAYIAEACDLAYTVLTDYVKPETTVGQTFETIIEEMKKLYPMSTLGSIAEDSKTLEVSAVIDSFEAIMAHITALKSVTDRIVALARGGLGGTIGSIEFDFEGLVKAATTVELIVGGSIAAVTGTLLYLFANDTLLTIIDKTIGKDRTIGKLLATTVGYTEEDGKYLFEGEENALANMLFNETVYAVATKGYDFKGTFYDYLLTDDIAMFAKAVVTKYAGDNRIGKAINAGLDGIADGYEGVHVSKIVDETGKIEIATVIETGTNVAAELTDGDVEKIIRASAVLAKDLFSGTVSAFGVNRNTAIDCLVDDVKAIVDVKVAAEKTEEFFAALKDLYGSEKLANIGPATKAIEINKVVTLASSAVRTFVGDRKGLISAIETLVNDVFSGKVEAFGVNQNTAIDTLVADIKAIVNLYKDNEKIDDVFAALADLYGSEKLANIGPATKAIEINKIVSLASATVRAFVGDQKGLISAIETLVNDVFSGKVEAFGVNRNTAIAVVINDVKAIINLYKNNDTIDNVFAKLCALYGDEVLANLMSATKNIEVEKVVDLGVAIVKGFTGDKAIIDRAAALVNTLVCGKISYPLFNDEATINEIADETNAIVDEIKFNEKAKGVVKEAISGLGELYSGITLNGFVAASKELTVKQVVDYVEKVALKAIDGKKKATDVVVAVCDLTNEVVSGTITKANIDEAKTDKVVLAVKGVTDALNLKYKVLDEAYTQLAGLYTDKALKNFVNDTKDLDVNVVINAAAEVAAKSASKQTAVIRKAADFANTLVCGKISYPLFNDEATINEIADETNAIVDEIKFNEKAKGVVKEAISGLGEMYSGITLNGFVAASKELTVKQVVDYVEKVALKAIDGNQKATDVVVAVCDLTNEVVSGTITKANIDEAKTDKVVLAVKGVTDALNLKYKVLDEAYTQLAGLYTDKALKNFVNDTKDLDVNVVINAAAEVAAKAASKQAAVIRKAADFANTLVCGKVSYPLFNDEATINEIADETNAIVDEIKFNEKAKGVVKEAISGLGEMYSGITLNGFVNATKELPVDEIIAYAEKVALKAVENKEKPTNIIAKTSDLGQYIATGTSGGGIKFDGDAAINVIADKAKALANAIGTGKAQPAVDSVFDAVGGVFNGIKLRNAKDEVKTLKIDKLIDAAGTIGIGTAKAFGKAYNAKITSLTELAKALVAGDVRKVGIERNAVVSDVANKANNVYGQWLKGKSATLDGVVEELVAKVTELYPNKTNTFGSFVKDSKELEVTSVIDSTSAVLSHIGATKSVTDRIAALAKASLNGKLSNLKFDFDGLVKEAKWYELAIGGGVALGAGTIMYFVANDKLVALADKVAKDKTIGDFAAKAAGYTAVDGKYLYEDEENELASTIFELKLHDVLTKGFDFKGAFEDKFVVDDIAMIAKAVSDKYASGKVETMLKTTFGEIAGLYPDVQVKDIVKATKELSMSGLFNSSAAIANAATDNKQEDRVNASAQLLDDMFYGTVSGFGFNPSTSISILVSDAKAIVKGNDDVNAIFDKVGALYGDALLGKIVSASKNISISGLIDLGETIVDIATKKKYTERLDASAQLLDDMFYGTVSGFGFNPSTSISILVSDAKAIVKGGDDVNAIFDKVGALYGDALLGKIVSASKNISISGLIDLGETIVDIATKKKYTEKLEAAAALLGETFYGTVSGFGFNRSANVSVMAAELNKIVGGMNVYVKASLGEIEKLTVNVYLGTIKADVKNIELADVLASVKVVTGKANGLNAKLEKLYKYLELAVGGTIGNPSFNYSKAFDAMSKTEKLVVAGVAVGAGVVLYKINNPLLVKIATKAFGKDSTWGEKFGKLAGYTLNGESGKYERSDGATNPMIDYLFKLNVVESLKTDFKLFDKAAEHVTLGNVLGFNSKTENILYKVFKGSKLVLDENDKWSIDRLALDHVENVLLNTNLKEVLDNKKDLKNYAFSKVDSFTLADLGFGSIVRKFGDGKKVKGFTATAEYDAETNLWTFDGRFEKLFDEVLNSTVGDIRNSKKNYGSFTKFVKAKFENLSVGDVLCDFIGISMERKGSTDIVTSFDEETGEWTVTGKYAAILDRLVNENLKTFIAKVSGKNAKAYLMSDRLLGGVRLGNLLDKGFNAYDETTDKWTNNEGEIEFASGFNGLLLKKVYNIKVGDVLGDDGFKVSQLTEGTYLAEVLGYVCGNTAAGHKHDENCTWYKEADVIVEAADGTTTAEKKLLEADALYSKLCAITLDDLTGGADIFAKIKELSLGELMGYMKATESEGEAQVTKYYNYRKSGDKFVVSVDPSDTYAVRRQGDEVGKLTATIAEVSVGSVMDGDGVNEMMNKIEALKIGDILRYTYTDTETGSEWQDGDGNAVGGMLAIFCDYTLGDVKSEDKLQEIVNKMTLRDVLGNSVDSNAIFKKLGDKKIGELTEAINDLYIGDILDYGKVENKTSDGYRIYVDNDGNEYYNTTVLDENGTFTGAWSSVDAANAATAAGIAFDSNVGRYKYADGKYLAESNDWNEKDGNAVTGVRSILANFKVGELDDPDFDARINSLVGTLVLSNVIEIDTSSPKILQLLANSKLNKLSEDINKLYIGEILDYSKITKTNAGGYSIYADVDGNEYYRDDNDNWFKANDNSAASITLDNETGRYKDANGKFLAEVNTWYDKDNKEVTGVTAILADFRIGELDDSDFNARVTASVENRKLGELMTIDTNSARVLQSLKDVKLKDLSTKINAMTLDNFIAIDENSPRILYLVKDATLKNLGATIDGLVLGDIMGYACGNKTEGHKHDKNCTWYTDGTLATPVEEIPAMIAKYTIKEVSDGNFASTLKGDINNLHISNFMAYDSCDIFKLFEEESTKDADGNIVEIGFNDLTIANMAESFNAKLEKPTLGDAVTLGVLDETLFTEKQTIAGVEKTNGEIFTEGYNAAMREQDSNWENIDVWQNIPAKGFLEYAIKKAFNLQ